jgi:predicted ArsR family transcriptional regulator
MSITEITRRESHEKVDKQTRYDQILAAMRGEMTAREVANALGYLDMNAVRPRITELCKEGYLVEAGIRIDPVTGRRVTCWRRAY